MSTRPSHWLSMLLIQGLSWWALYAWKINGNEHAGNLLTFWLGLISAIGLLMLFVPPKLPVASRGPVHRAVGVGSSILMVAALAWFGHFALAAVYAVACACAATYRSAEVV